MGEVVGAHGGLVLSERGQNEDCITCLEGLLQKARDGEICGVAVAIQYSDRSNGESVGGFIWHRGAIGSMHYLINRLVEAG